MNTELQSILTVNMMFCDNDKDFVPDAIKSLNPNWNLVLQKNIKGNATNKITRVNDRLMLIDNYYTGDFNFSMARNVMRTASHTEWILSLDADERLLTHQHYQLEQLLKIMPQNCGAIGVVIISPLDYDTDVPASEGIHVSKSSATRIFRHDLVWEHPIHETMVFDMARRGLSQFNSGILIHHLGYSLGHEEYIRKLRRNYGALSKLDTGNMSQEERKYYMMKLQDTAMSLRQAEAKPNYNIYGKQDQQDEMKDKIKQFINGDKTI